MQIVNAKLSDLTLDAQNAKEHTTTQLQQLAESIRQFGFNDPVGVWGENNLIIEGHGRYMAAKMLELDEIPVIRLDHLDEDQRKAYALAHNQINMSTGFDPEKLNEILKELEGAIDMGVFGLELPEPDEAELVTEDDYEMPANLMTRVKKGEVWKLGEHRLACMDSTASDTYKALGGGFYDLVVTDPPYNVDYTGVTKDKLKIQNDMMELSKFEEFLTDAFKQMVMHLKDGGALYSWYASRTHTSFEKALNNVGLVVRQQLIWVKNVFTLGRQDYQWKHEPCMYTWKEGTKHYFVDSRTKTTTLEPTEMENLSKLKRGELLQRYRELLEQLDAKPTTIIRENKPSANDIHPTMKPVRLLARLIANSSRPGEKVLDPFGGSGSTLIACEKLGRVCHTIELDEKYASAIVDRWEELTGQKAEKIC